ncbi:MAG TPA: hypothetical protein VIJ65_09260 [Acidobacteriaceae bacterium]
MSQPELVFEGTEGDVLIALYEWPNVTFSSHTLTQRLNPNFQITAPEYRTAFAHVSSVIEEHIVRGLIRGKRSRNDDGVFFNNLKLTSKGEQAAIQERKRRALPGRVKQLLDVAELIRERLRGAKG